MIISCSCIEKQKGILDGEDQFQGQLFPKIQDVSSDSSFTSFFEMNSKGSRHETSSSQLVSSSCPKLQSASNQSINYREGYKLDDPEKCIESKGKSRDKRGGNFQRIKNQSEKKNFPIFITRNIKSLVNSTLKLKKRGKLSSNSNLFQRFLQFFSKGLKKSESIRTLKAFLNFSQSVINEPKQKRIVEEFSTFIQPNIQISANQFLKLSTQMREWILTNRQQLIKLASNSKNSNYNQYIKDFLQDLTDGEVKLYRK